MTALKVVNTLTAEELNEVLETMDGRGLQVIMEPGRDDDHLYSVEHDDHIGNVLKIQNDNVHFSVVIELEEHHRFVERSVFEFMRISGFFYLVQKEPRSND